MKKFTLVLGGTQGEGTASAGTIISRVLSRSGYYTYTRRTFSSRIKGGHTRSRIEISPVRNMCAGKSTNLVFALDRTTAETPFDFSIDGSLRIIDEKLRAPSQTEYGNIYLPLSETAEKTGNNLAKTTVALGLACRMLGLDEKLFAELLAEKYGKKGSAVVKTNLAAFEAGLAMGELAEIEGPGNFMLESVPRVSRPVMTGNYAIALGALAGGCRFLSAYPITPASEIMEYLSAKLPDLGGVMIQTEDEIAAVTMAIGASYGGARSMTATSGPGISLMLEGIGLASMAEIPIVIVDTQRVGPSTGLPTKLEQSDMDAAIYGGHGEFPSIVLAPFSVETCFSLSREAFGLADEFSCPVFVMSDLALGLFPQTIDPFPYETSGSETREAASEDLGEGEYFKRYRGNETFRPAPGTSGGIHYTTGLEHGPLGAPDNKAENRVRMMKRRMEKFNPLSMSPGIRTGKTKGRILLIATGSAYGACQMAVEDLDEDVVLGAIYRLKPFPTRQLANLSDDFESILVVEYNYQGQLFHLLKKNLPARNLNKLHGLKKFSGEPFYALEISNAAKELM